jgi:hypothetical protein
LPLFYTIFHHLAYVARWSTNTFWILKRRVILALFAHNNGTTSRHIGMRYNVWENDKCTSYVQQGYNTPLTWGGLHTLWGPPMWERCCTLVVHVVYGNHLSNVWAPPNVHWCCVIVVHCECFDHFHFKNKIRWKTTLPHKQSVEKLYKNVVMNHYSL